MDVDTRTILVRAPNWLGDAVMALPAMAALRAAFRDRELLVAAPASVAPLFLEDTDAAPDRVMTVDRRREAEDLRASGAGIVILLPNSFGSAWVARRAGIPERWGYRAGGRSLLLTRGVARPRGRLHQSAYYRALVAGLGIEAPDVLPRVGVREATARRTAALLERASVDRAAPLVGFAPGAAYGHAKRWPPARVAALVHRLSDRGCTCVLVGAAGDREAGREIESSLPSGLRLHNLIGRTDLRLLVGLLSSCQAFVSNDSGAMHVAAAAGVPVAAIFGPTDERATAPLGDHDVILHQVFCRPCMLRDCPIDHRCMRGISVDRVFEAVVRRLDARAAPVAGF